MVSGHTHFGQIWPLGHLMNLFKINEMNYGYERVGNMDIIVSSGMGGWGYPIRTEKKCEYLIPYDRSDINSFLHRNGRVLQEEYRENGTFMIVEVDDESYNKSKDYIINIIM